MKSPRGTHDLKLSPLHKLGNHRRLAEILKVSCGELKLLSRCGVAGYSIWEEVNDKGKARVIENPRPKLKRVQRRLAALLSQIAPPDFLMCPVKGRSYVHNARLHVGAGEIVTLDISKYFPSTTWRRAYWFFNKQLGASPDVAWTLASLASLDGRLPTGSPLRPILAYFAHQDMWLAVERLVRDGGCEFTLYMDDLTISGGRVPEALLWAVKRKIHAAGLRLNKLKERRYSRGEGMVTGVIVTRDGVRLPKRAHLKLTNLKHERHAAIDGQAKAKLERRIRGVEAQHRQVLHAPRLARD